MKSDRKIILENIRKSLSGSRTVVTSDSDLDNKIREKLNSITPIAQNDLVNQFKDELEKVDAEFINIESKEEVLPTLQRILNKNAVNKIAISDSDQTNELAETLRYVAIVKATEYEYSKRKKEISQIETALLFADNGIADIGSVVFYYDNTKTTYPHFLCDWSIILIKRDSIFANQFDLIENVETEKTKNMVFVTGPSRTADIEKTLILGAHGPRRVTIIGIP